MVTSFVPKILCLHQEYQITGYVCTLAVLTKSSSTNQLIASHKTVKIQDQNVDVRRLVTPSDRLIVSNVRVCPSIPNNIIEDTLKKLGLNLLTRMTYLRVGMPESEYTHILSFRRQIFITPPDNPIPDSTTVTYENTTYRIFLSNEGLSCTLCKQTGHLASKCPCQPIKSNIVEKNPEISTMNAPLTTTEEPENTPINNSPPTIPSDTNIVTEAPQQTKRQLSANSDHSEPDPAPTDAIAKKLKTSEEIEDTLKTAEDFINSQFNITKMNITEVADMIENAHKSKDIITTVKNYTNDIPHLINS
nr:unnamed protein product [Callosobruchus analis]